MFGDEEMEAKILKTIEKKPHGTYIEELARELKLNRATVRNYVAVLEAKGKIMIEQRGTAKMMYPA